MFGQMVHKRCWYSDVEDVNCVHGRTRYERNGPARAMEATGEALSWAFVRVTLPVAEMFDACDRLRRRRRAGRAVARQAALRGA